MFCLYVLNSQSPSPPFDGVKDLVGAAHECDFSKITNAVAYAEYWDCDGKTTSERCTPTCLP